MWNEKTFFSALKPSNNTLAKTWHLFWSFIRRWSLKKSCHAFDHTKGAKKNQGWLWARAGWALPKGRHLAENQALGTPACLPQPLLGPAQPWGTGRHSPSVTALPLGTLPRSTVGPSRKIVSSPPETTPPLFSVCRFRVSCVFSTVGHKRQQGQTKANAPQCKILQVISFHLTYPGIPGSIFKFVLWHRKKKTWNMCPLSSLLY